MTPEEFLDTIKKGLMDAEKAEEIKEVVSFILLNNMLGKHDSITNPDDLRNDEAAAKFARYSVSDDGGCSMLYKTNVPSLTICKFWGRVVDGVVHLDDPWPGPRLPAEKSGPLSQMFLSEDRRTVEHLEFIRRCADALTEDGRLRRAMLALKLERL